MPKKTIEKRIKVFRLNNSVKKSLFVKSDLKKSYNKKESFTLKLDNTINQTSSIIPCGRNVINDFSRPILYCYPDSILGKHHFLSVVQKTHPENLS